MPDPAVVPDDWQVARLGDVAEVAFSSVDKKTIDGEVPVELCNYTDVFYNRRILRDMPFMAATASPAECGRWSLRQGDVLFTKDSETPDEIGIPSYVAEDMPDVLCGYHLALARPAPGLADGAFLARALGSRAAAQGFARIANGVTRFGLTLGATRSLPIPLPPLAEQRAIAAVLDAIDEAIECTEEVIAATERLRDALLHELLTRGLPGRHSEWADVPGLGTVPACWDVVRLGDVCEVTSGFAMGPQRAPRDHPRPYLTVANVHTDHVTVDEVRYMELTDAEYASRSLRAGDVVVVEGHAQVSQLGRAAIVPPSAEGFTFQNHLFRVRLLDWGDLGFVTAFINGLRGRAYFASFGGTTSGLNTVSARNVRLLPLPWPSGSEQQAIAAALDGVGGTIERAREERARLHSLQASAADALLTGRVRVASETLER